MLEVFHKLAPYALPKAEKEKLLLSAMRELTEWHRHRCVSYQRYLDAIGYDPAGVKTLENVPFLPIRAFKELQMKSISDDAVFKVMMSSGTSGQKQSRIYLDRETAVLQQKVLLRLLGDFIGNRRLPMLVIDSDAVIRDRRNFTTRGATIMGLEFAARRMVFALDEQMQLKEDVLDNFIQAHGAEPFLVFGFTFMVWQHLFQRLKQAGRTADLSNAYLLTAGGWKKLVNLKISNEDFQNMGQAVCGIKHYVDHYGMAEQTGCIYAACEYGHLHASIYSDVMIRRFRDFSPCKIGERGFIQLLSSLPHSYPGHSILTEDEGIIEGEDDCPCGRKGKYIRILGRVEQAEIRGCSDTYGARI